MKHFTGIFTPIVTPFRDRRHGRRGARCGATSRAGCGRRSPVWSCSARTAKRRSSTTTKPIAWWRSSASEVPARPSAASSAPAASPRARRSPPRARAARAGADAVLVRTPSFFKAQMTSDVFVAPLHGGGRRLAGAGAALQRDDVHRREPAGGRGGSARRPSQHRRHEGIGQRHRRRSPTASPARPTTSRCWPVRPPRSSTRSAPAATAASWRWRRCCPTTCVRLQTLVREQPARRGARAAAPAHAARALDRRHATAWPASRPRSTCSAMPADRRGRRCGPRRRDRRDHSRPARGARRAAPGHCGEAARATRLSTYTDPLDEVSLPMPLPSTERILLGPGPSLIAPRVMRAMAAPVLSHLDPDFVPLLDDVRASLRRAVPRRRAGADARHVGHRHVGDGSGGRQHRVRRHARASSSSPATSAIAWRRSSSATAPRVRRIDVEWGRAVDPQRLRDELKQRGRRRRRHRPRRNVHRRAATRSKELAAIAREHGALTIVDTVTSLGGHEVELAGWGVDVAYSCSAEVHRRAVGHVADCRVGSGARAAGEVPQLLSGSEAARGLLGQAASTTTRCPRR